MVSFRFMVEMQNITATTNIPPTWFFKLDAKVCGWAYNAQWIEQVDFVHQFKKKSALFNGV